MLMKLIHKTELSYSDLISESVMELRMAPRQEMDQHRLSFDLAIGPPTSVTSYFDWLGNTVHAFSVNAFHKDIKIMATSVVETDRPRRDLAQLSDSWPVLSDMYDYTNYDYLQFGGPVVDAPLLRDLAAQLNPEPGMRLGQLTQRMLDLIDGKFVYKKGITTAASPITEILEHGKGVCQDFTHLMIGLARAMRIPGRYVSGLVHQEEAQKIRGHTQTHAWCELLFPSVGWVGFDPTNKCTIGPNFVKVAIGRDFRDVPPNRGVYRGKATDSIEVAVKSEEIPSIPPELAAERFQALSVPVFIEPSAAQRALVAQQQEHQQQQEQQQQQSAIRASLK